MVSPNLRRALHQALDLVLDAIEDDAQQTPKKRTRGPAIPKPLPMPDLPAEELAAIDAQLERQMAKAGFRRTDR